MAKAINVLLNKAFRTSFLKKFEGDRHRHLPRSYVHPDGRLDEILEIFLFGFSEKPIGTFTNQDGSSLSVYPEYAGQARKYAKLYKDAYKKDVQVDLINP